MTIASGSGGVGLVSLSGYLKMVANSTTDTLQGKGGGGGNPATVLKFTVVATAFLGAFGGYALNPPRRRTARAA
jgi:hypothetical protein